ncbi:MAG: signal peptidase I [Thermoplasmata archaeon]
MALTLSATAIAVSQVYNFVARYLTVKETYFGALVVPGVTLLLLLAASRWEGRPLREFGFILTAPWTATLAFASLLALLYLALRLDPGFIFSFGRIMSPPPLVFGFFLLSAPLVALAEVGLFVGYAFRTFARAMPLGGAVLLSASLFAGYSTNGAALPLLGTDAALQYLFTVTFVSFALGMVLALYFYKAQWSLLGPVALTIVLLTTASLLPVGVRFPSWEVDFAASLVAYAVLLIVVGIGLQEPHLQALRYLGTRIGPRRYRFRNRARDRSTLRDSLVGAAVVGVVVLSVSYGLPAVLGTPSTPFLAIATGSMVPTFHRGEFVVIEHVAPTAIRVGTIIAFSVSCLPSPTVHRVIRVVSVGPKWVYQTKGDANSVQDPCTVPYSHVLGAVVFYVPYLGFLILDPLFAAALVALIILLALVRRGGLR